MNLHEVFANPDILKSLATILAALLMAGGIALVSLSGLKLSVKQAQQVRYYWREYYPTLRAQIDQPTDSIPSALDRILDRVLYADWDKLISAAAVALVDSVNKHVDPQEAIPQPEQSAPEPPSA
jgi:predicted PurR-regulated permease PerM